MSPSLTDYRIIAYGGPLSGRSFSDLIRERFSGIAPTAEPETFPFVSNLKLWLRADDLDLVDGAMVGVWPDSSGNAFDAIQTTEANKPIFKEDILNGRPVLRFDGVNDYLDKAITGLEGAAGQSVFIVLSSDDNGTQHISIGQMSGGTSGSWFVDIGAPSTIRYTIINDSSVRVNHDSGPVAWGAGTWILFSGTYDGALIRGWSSGSALTPASLAQTGLLKVSGFNLNIGRYTGGFYWDGDIAEVLVYNRALATNERKAVERYLGTKYGIAVA